MNVKLNIGLRALAVCVIVGLVLVFAGLLIVPLVGDVLGTLLLAALLAAVFVPVARAFGFFRSP